MAAVAMISALGVIGAVGASAAPGLRVTIQYRVTSNEVVGDERFLTLVGTGHSRDLGTLEATSSVVSTPAIPPAGGCSTRTSDDVWTTPTGSLEVHTEGLFCADGKLTGTWTVTGGSGTFTNASGSGELRGVGGQGRLVFSYTGAISA